MLETLHILLQKPYKLGTRSSLFVHFMIHILFPGSNNIQTATPFKILNDVLDCILLDL
jgi:hypothetical protein